MTTLATYTITRLDEALAIAHARGLTPRELLREWGHGTAEHYGRGGGSAGDRYNALLAYCLRHAL